jgi:hypothetical protein
MMRKRLLSLVGLALVAPVALGAIGMSSVSADTGITLTIGKPTLTDRLLVAVPVTVVCAPLPDTTLVDSVSVTVEQASRRTISSGTGTVMGGPGSFQPSNPPFLTCDGITPNKVSVSFLPTQGSGPFNVGKAIITVSAVHSAGSCSFPGFCQATGSESVQVGPTSVKLGR